MGALLAASFVLYVLGSGLYWAGGGSPKDQLQDDLELLGIEDARAADEFSKIALGAMVVPSQKKEGNMDVMLSVKGTGSFEDEYDGDVQGSITDEYFAFEDTQDFFPDLVFTENTVPYGNPKPYCIHLEWNARNRRNMIDRYVSVKGQPRCKNSLNSKVRWNPTDPMNGIDF